MAIVIPNDSYVTVAQLRTYAEQRGFDLPTEDSAVEVFLIKARDYLNVQPLAWTGDVPGNVKIAQMQLAIESFKGVDLMPTSGATPFIKREKIGPIETEFSETVGAASGSGPNFPFVDALLAPFLSSSVGTFLRLRRV